MSYQSVASPPYIPPENNLSFSINPNDICDIEFHATQNINDQIFGPNYPESCPPIKGTLTLSQSISDFFFYGDRFSQGPPFGFTFYDRATGNFYETDNTLQLPNPLPPQPSVLQIYPLLGDSIGVGHTYSESGSFVDPTSNATIQIATVDYGDGSGTQPLTLYGPNFILNHKYITAGIYTITVSITDDQGTIATQTGVVNVYALPQINISGKTITMEPYSNAISSGSRAAFAANGTFSDPNPTATSWTGEIFFGDGSYGNLSISDNTFTSSIINKYYYQTGTYPITILITDNLGLTVTGRGTATVTVNNASTPPTVGTINITPILFK